MYQTIINPLSNRKVKTNSKLGRFILNKYIYQLGGVTASNLNCSNKLGDPLGSGSFKTAYKTNCNEWKGDEQFSDSFTKEDCDNSVILLTEEPDKQFYEELEIQKKIKNPKIFKYGKCNGRDEKYKIEEKFDEDLFDLNKYHYKYNISILDSPNLLNNFKEKFKEVLLTLDYLHNTLKKGHFDIKPENIMVKYKLGTKEIDKLVLIDFGFVSDSPSYGLKGTPGYIDPDAIRTDRSELTLKSDIYSLGITLMDTLFKSIGKFAFSSNWQKKIRSQLIRIWRKCPHDSDTKDSWQNRAIPVEFHKYNLFLDLLFNMLMCPRENRYDINQVINHQWFNVEGHTMEEEEDEHGAAFYKADNFEGIGEDEHEIIEDEKERGSDTSSEEEVFFSAIEPETDPSTEPSSKALVPAWKRKKSSSEEEGWWSDPVVEPIRKARVPWNTWQGSSEHF